MRKPILGQPVSCRWSVDCDVNSFQPANPDNPSRSTIRRNRRLLDMLLSAGDVATARKIVAAYHPHFRDYEDKIRQCAAEIRSKETLERLRTRVYPLAGIGTGTTPTKHHAG
jgi:hypothetical protein